MIHMKDNREFIASAFENESITAPESLSEQHIRELLEQGGSVNNIVPLKKNKKRRLKRFAAAVACIVLVIGSVLSVNALRNAHVNRVIDSNTKNGVVYFDSYDEVQSFVSKMDTNDGIRYRGLLLPQVRDTFNKSATADFAVNNEGSVAGVAARSHSGTYTQVADVDEADIVKTDGKYIYFLDSSDGTLVIYAVNGKETKLTSKYYFDEEEYVSFEEMYLDGDRLYLLGTSYDDDIDDDQTVVCTLDISNREEVAQADTYRQSGAYKTSRMANGCLYVISNTYKYSKKYIPCCTDKDGKYKKIPATDICAFRCCRVPNYAVVGALNTKNGKSKEQKVKAVMGGAENVYCTTKNLYVACVNYDDSSTSTVIVKFALDGIKIKEQAVGTVRGTVNNQWSFDEKDGYLRVATTAYSNSGEQVNKLYVLNKKLKKVGDVGGYAKGEHIEAVKYIGDMAYVITYETTDPLFIIDLSNPKAPQITGKIKIDGFSTNLMPVGEDKLMGIGYHTRTNKEWGGIERAGVKLVLFDISDKNKPAVLDEKVYKNAYSDAQETHKAITLNGDLLAIPVNYDNADEEAAEEYETKGSAVVFTEQDGKIKVVKEQSFDSGISRITYTGDYYYAVDTVSDTVTAFRLK